MTNFIFCCVSILVFAAAATPARSAEQAANKRVLSHASSPMNSSDDCDARIQQFDDSQAEGEDRLREKYAVIDYCGSQYKNDKTIGRLVKQCAKYVEQPVVKQQFAADCMLAAYKYANALSALKAEYGK